MKKIKRNTTIFFGLIKKIFEKEKKLIIILIIIFGLILITPILTNKYLIEIPSMGGEINEIKISESPRFINPVLAISSADKDFLPLVYTPILERNYDGKIIPAAGSLKFSEDKKTYFIKILSEIFFSNGEEMTADDVIFTIQKIQDPLLKSPYYSNWLKVKVEKIDKYNLKIILPEEYAQFKNILTNLYIMPKSAWTGVSVSEFPFTSLSTHPIGSGPFIISKIDRNIKTGKIKKYQLIKNKKFYKNKVFIDKLNIYFFNNIDDYKKSLIFSNKKIIKNISGVNFSSIKDLASKKSYLKSRIIELKNPKIFALFLGKNYNTNLSNHSLRKAIASAIKKEEITENILLTYAEPMNSIYPFQSSEEIEIESHNFNEIKEELKNSFSFDAEDNLINKKNKKKVSLKLSTVNSKEFKEIAENIKKDLKEIGIDIEIILFKENELINKVIRNREFEILLYGYQLDIKPDFYYFFHSSQISDPGINISQISDKKIDHILINLRNNMPEQERKEKTKQLNNLILKDYSFIPLYTPSFIYIIDNRIRNFYRNKINSSEERFVDIDKWYVKTKKVLPFSYND